MPAKPRSLFNLRQNNGLKEQMVVEWKDKEEGKRQLGKTQGMAKAQGRTQEMDKTGAHEMGNKNI